MKGKGHKLVIIGNGMATGRLLDELAARRVTGCGITVVGEEAQGSYNRILLSSVLAGEAAAGDIVQKSPHWFRERGIRFVNARAHGIDRLRKRVSCGGDPAGISHQPPTEAVPGGALARDADEKCRLYIPYDHLVIATGSRPSRIGAAGQELPGVFHFRSIADTEAIGARAANASRGAVIGGGLLGLEAAWGLARKGVEVTVVQRGAWLMNRQLDRTSAALLEEVLAERGIRVKLGCEAVAFHAGAGGEVASVTLSDGSTLPAGIAVIATGITPNAELGFAAGLEGRKAIRVDDFMRSSDPAISALGECVEHAGGTFGLVEPIWDQCATLAARLAGEKPAPFRRRAYSTRLKVSGVQLFSMGELEHADGMRAVELLDARRRVYRKLLLRGDRLCGAVLFGDVRGGLDYLRLMRERLPCAGELTQLLLTGALAPEAGAAPLRQAG